MDTLTGSGWKFELSVTSAQIQGDRTLQEDSYIAWHVPAGLIVVVADGLGGHPKGERASHFATSWVARSLTDSLAGHDCDIATAMRQAIANAEAEVKALDHDGPSLRPPATTLVAGVFLPRERQFRAAYIGDSILGLMREDQFIQLFEPQTYQGKIIRPLGMKWSNPEYLDSGCALEIGDRFLFATDGIESLPTHEIVDHLKQTSARIACEGLLSAVSALDLPPPGQDNATVVIVDVVANGTGWER